MKKFRIMSAVLSLLMILSFSACVPVPKTTDFMPEAPETSVSPTPTTPETSVPPAPTHTHTFSDEWEFDENNHWHAANCGHTLTYKDYSAHRFINNVCKMCGYKVPDPYDTTNGLPDASLLPQTDFKDTGDKYDTITKPFYEVAETILQDLVENGDIGVNENQYERRNPRITAIRYCYGTSLMIILREDIYTGETGEKSEFLQLETGISLENFSEHYGETYLAYHNFFTAERKCESYDNYEEFILLYAKKSAEMILSEYERYKNSDDKEIAILNLGKHIVLSAGSPLSEKYEKIVENLNVALATKGFPLLTNQDLDITFGGNIYWDIPIRSINIDANIGLLNYSFHICFNEDGEFSQDYINHLMGTLYTGYTPSDPDMYNSVNDEYAEFFDKIKIEEMDLSNPKHSASYEYDDTGCALFCSAEGEHTWLYF